ncbi:MAG: carbon-nitrogen hydrolase family protein [Planctomycetaceae bacterium]|nr:carbon-nitrogen hydrolase family protein [Planctomycetaceae bacterium]
MSLSARADERPRTVKVAAIQCSSELGDVAANSKKLAALVREAAAGGAKFIVLPETAITGYVSQDLHWNWHVAGRPIEKMFRGKDPAPYAQTVPGPATEQFCALAKELKIYLTIPLLERVDAAAVDRASDERPPPKYFNTVCLAAPDGRLAAHYRKLNPWPLPEKSWATPGDRGIQTIDTEYGRVGLAICFDIHTILEDYKDQKLWALLYPIAWVDEEHPAEWFYHRLPQHVGKFKHHLIGANWSVDQPQRWRGYGFSTIISGDGHVLAAAKSLYGSEIVYAELPVADLKKPSP